MKHHDEYELGFYPDKATVINSSQAQVIKQKLQLSIKKYIKLNKKKNSIENELQNISRDIQKYKLSYEEVS